MEIGKITKLNENMNYERLRLIALGRRKEKELGKKPGELFSTVLFTTGYSKGQGGAITAGYYKNEDKTIRIYDRYLSKGRAYTDEIMLHELVHGLDHATEGYTERSNVHDERFVIAVRTLGANVSKYLKDNKEKMKEEALEKKRMQSYIPPEFQNLPDDRNNCSLIFNVSKRPTIICSNYMQKLLFNDVGLCRYLWRLAERLR